MDLVPAVKQVGLRAEYHPHVFHWESEIDEHVIHFTADQFVLGLLYALAQDCYSPGHPDLPGQDVPGHFPRFPLLLVLEEAAKRAHANKKPDTPGVATAPLSLRHIGLLRDLLWPQHQEHEIAQRCYYEAVGRGEPAGVDPLVDDRFTLQRSPQFVAAWQGLRVACDAQYRSEADANALFGLFRDGGFEGLPLKDLRVAVIPWHLVNVPRLNEMLAAEGRPTIY